MKVVFIAAECSPIVKVGGLGDVVGSLPKALKKLGVDISIVIPFYKPIKLKDKKIVRKDIKITFNQKEEVFNLWTTVLPQTKIPVYLIENKKYLSSKGIYIKEDASSGGTIREAGRFLFFSKAAIMVGKMLNAHILHCHDWHTAIIPFLLKNTKENIKVKTLLTIHNLGYQGIYSAPVVNKLLETNFSKKVNCLKIGIINTNFITTVSPTYAKEILTKEFSFGLGNYLKKRKKNLYGILNGLDEKTWNPKTDEFIIKNYSSKDIGEKIKNKIYLQKLFFKEKNSSIPIIAIVSRLAQQKGINLVIKIFAELMGKNLQFILLGKGRKTYEKFFIRMNKKYPAQFKAKIKFNEKLAHQIYAGSDIFLMPSFYEPCGLGQEIAMKYGTVPIIRAVGGLKDTVSKIQLSSNGVKGTGFVFKNFSSLAFQQAIEKSLYLYKNQKIWRKIQINGMKKDFSWEKSAKKYLNLYLKLLSRNEKGKAPYSSRRLFQS